MCLREPTDKPGERIKLRDTDPNSNTPLSRLKIEKKKELRRRRHQQLEYIYSFAGLHCIYTPKYSCRNVKENSNKTKNEKNMRSNGHGCEPPPEQV